MPFTVSINVSCTALCVEEVASLVVTLVGLCIPEGASELDLTERRGKGGLAPRPGRQHMLLALFAFWYHNLLLLSPNLKKKLLVLRAI